jgi:glucose uptake protein GlcU
MKKSTINIIINLLFGLLFFYIGFVNTFWGNDPFYGLFIIFLSILFFLPIINLFIEKIPQKALFILKIILGLFIIWSSLGVGELFDKIELMKMSFPLPTYEAVGKD